MREIPLTQGKIAIVDDADVEIVRPFTWYAYRQEMVLGTSWYAKTNRKINGRQKGVLMHRLIVNPKPQFDVDHWDSDGLNNQRTNLRICTRSQNCQNRRKQTGTTSRFKGVHWNTGRHKWKAQIFLNKQIKYLGLFCDETEAAIAYDAAARLLFGEFAITNFQS